MIANIRELNYTKYCKRLNHVFNNFKREVIHNVSAETNINRISEENVKKLCKKYNIKYRNLVENIECFKEEGVKYYKKGKVLYYLEKLKK